MKFKMQMVKYSLGELDLSNNEEGELKLFEDILEEFTLINCNQVKSTI